MNDTEVKSTGCMKCGIRSDIAHYVGCPEIQDIIDGEKKVESLILKKFDKQFPLPLSQADESGGIDARPYIHTFITESIQQAVVEERKMSVEIIDAEFKLLVDSYCPIDGYYILLKSIKDKILAHTAK